MSNLLDLLEEASRQERTLRIVSSMGSPPEERSFGDVWRQSEDAARWLSSRFRPGEAVGALLTSSLECVVSAVGAWRAGLTLASLPLPSRGMDGDEYAKQVDAACAAVGASLVLAEGTALKALPPLSCRAESYDVCLSSGPGPLPDGGGGLVQFTSGSTNHPKGVRLTLEAVGANVTVLRDLLQTEDGDLACSWLPMSHDMGLIGLLLAGWGSGLHLCLVRTEAFARVPSIWLSACSAFGATHTVTPNFAFDLARRRLGRSGPLDLSRLRACITGAEPVRPESLRAFVAEATPCGFRERALMPAYGLAEATLAVASVRIAEEWKADRVDVDALGAGERVLVPDGPAAEIACLGRAIDPMEVRVVADDGAHVGEIQVAGPSLLDGYVGAQAPIEEGRWLRTGDLGYLVGGELYITGRLDDLLQVGGQNVYAAELEDVAACHPAVRRDNCAVVPHGAGRYAVVAECRARPSADGTLEEALRAVRDVLVRRFGIAPASLVAVPPRALPRTPSGKIQRRKLQQLLELDELPVRARIDVGV